MEKTERMAVLEAVLFAHGDPVGTDKLAAALEWPEALVQEGLEALQARCMQPDSGLTLLRLGTTGSWPPKTSTAPTSAAPWKTGGPRPCPRRRWRR